MADEAPADDLRSLLSESFDKQMSTTALSDGVITPPEPKADTKPDAEPKAGDDRPRGPDGKFAKKADEPPAKADDKPKEPEAKEAEPPAKADDKPAEPDKDKQPDAKPTDGKEPPANWPASDKAMFKLQTPEAQDFLLRRVRELETGFNKKFEQVADLRRDYEPVQQLFAPHLEVLKQKGLNPASVIQRWADVETQLASGDPQKQLRIVAGIVQGYNIDKSAVAHALGLAGGAQLQQQAPNQTAAASDDPVAQQLAALEQRIASAFAPHLNKIDQWERQQQQAQVAALSRSEQEAETKISSFKTAAGQDGQPLHPFFDEVERDMIALAQSYKASGQPIPDLPQLYESAVWANPSTRQALLATQQAAQAAKATEEARAKAASARKAGSSVTGAPGAGQAATKIRSELSLREQLEEAAAELG